MSDKNSTNQHNFPFEHEGKTLWYSRSTAVSCYIFARNINFEWCVLANKRGPGCPNNVGLWNAPCGFLDFNETNIDACKRETWEETGVELPSKRVILDGVRVNAVGDQNVSLSHVCFLSKCTTAYPLSASNCEPGEVDDIRWIPVKDIDKYKWAHEHEKRIPYMFHKYVGQHEDAYHQYRACSEEREDGSTLWWIEKKWLCFWINPLEEFDWDGTSTSKWRTTDKVELIHRFNEYNEDELRSRSKGVVKEPLTNNNNG